MKTHKFLLPIVACGFAAMSLVQAQTGTVDTRTVPSTANVADQGYLRMNGRTYVVRGNIAYPLAGAVTQQISPAAASTLREGFLLNSSGQLVTAPAGLTFSTTPAPTTSVQAERSTATRPVTGENVSGLAPNTNTNTGTATRSVQVPSAPTGTSVRPGMSAGSSTTTQGQPQTNQVQGTTTLPNGTQPQAPAGIQQNGTQPQVPAETQQNGTQPTAPNNTQQNGTQPQVPNSTQPNGTISPPNANMQRSTNNPNASPAGTGGPPGSINQNSPVPRSPNFSPAGTENSSRAPGSLNQNSPVPRSPNFSPAGTENSSRAPGSLNQNSPVPRSPSGGN